MVDKMAMEIVSKKALPTISILAKSKCTSFKNIVPISGTREKSFIQSTSKNAKDITVQKITPAKKYVVLLFEASCMFVGKFLKI